MNQFSSLWSLFCQNKMISSTLSPSLWYMIIANMPAVSNTCNQHGRADLAMTKKTKGCQPSKFPLNIFHLIDLKYWIRQWLPASKHQPFTWASVDPDLCHHTHTTRKLWVWEFWRKITMSIQGTCVWCIITKTLGANCLLSDFLWSKQLEYGTKV